MTLWEDELRQRGEEECCGYLGVRYCAGNATRLLVRARRRTDAHAPTAGAVKPQHNDPQLFARGGLLSAAQNKVLAPYACGPGTLLHLPGFYMHQSITFACPA